MGNMRLGTRRLLDWIALWLSKAGGDWDARRQPPPPMGECVALSEKHWKRKCSWLSFSENGEESGRVSSGKRASSSGLYVDFNRRDVSQLAKCIRSEPSPGVLEGGISNLIDERLMSAI